MSTSSTSRDILYRQSTLGLCLSETLKEMISTNKIDTELERLIMLQFDKSIQYNIEKYSTTTATLAGVKTSHNLCDDIWSIDSKNIKIIAKGNELNTNKLKIIAVPDDKDKEKKNTI